MVNAPSNIKPLAVNSIDFHWLDGTPTSNTHTTEFGAPWPQGQVFKSTAFALTGEDGKGVPVQSYPLAYWEDGSLKWSGHTIAPNAGLTSKLTLAPGTPVEHATPVSVKKGGDNESYQISTGTFRAVIKTSGTELFQSLSIDGNNKGKNGQLVLQVQDIPDSWDNGRTPVVTSALGNIETCEVEKDGPIRAVLKLTGRYQPQDSKKGALLPFTLRVIVGAGGTELRIVHTFTLDVGPSEDNIKGLGLSFKVPFQSDEKLWDRHVRFGSTEGGVWGESVNVLTGLRRDVLPAVSGPQFEGTPTPDTSSWPATVTPYLDSLPAWNDFSLVQLDADSFSIWKRVQENRGSWLKHAGFGSRASGLGFVGGAVHGGIIFAERDFWEMYPRGLDVRKAGSENATVTVWAYSPAGESMDQRHYDNIDHKLDLIYEDNPNPAATSTPVGISRSYEISLIATTATPSRDYLGELSKVVSKPPALFATPEFYQSAKLFGDQWATPNANLPLEKKQSSLLDWYLQEIESRRWYGFWNFGDVMHTYDSVRHEWRYDVGGYAWDNAELGTDLWLWTAFLRTGRSDIFRIAHAMTRHLTESDFYSGGTFAGLGSRHNVSHWGDGAKEARVGGSHLKRPMYYLSGGDEALGDALKKSLQVDETLRKWEPLREYLPTPHAPARVRIGPDWVALVGNWLTEWERSGDTKFKDKIRTGMVDIGAFPYGMFQGGYGGAVGFDPATGHLTNEDDISASFSAAYNLAHLFGGFELLCEVVTLLDVPTFDKAFLDFCWLMSGTAAEKTSVYGKTFSTGAFLQLYAKNLAYVGARRNNQSLIDRAWVQFNTNKTGVWPDPVTVGGSDFIKPISEIVGMATNDSASLSLAMFSLLKNYPQGAPQSLVAEATISEIDDDDTASTFIGSFVEEKASKTKSLLEAGSSKKLDSSKPKRKGFWARVRKMLGL
ncbi:hypothetical protein BDY24DRAFT_415569 [Mrakia frigida]|uniref:uncharacterized protein n=1 Tax=Mrakia frigida TaxID=29902 RepID=UPI003FCC06BB